VGGSGEVLLRDCITLGKEGRRFWCKASGPIRGVLGQSVILQSRWIRRGGEGCKKHPTNREKQGLEDILGEGGCVSRANGERKMGYRGSKAKRGLSQ